MSRILSCYLLADLAISTELHKVLSGLIVNKNQLEICQKSNFLVQLKSREFLAQQGLYVSTIAHKIMDIHDSLNINFSSQVPIFNSLNQSKEQPFVHIGAQSNSNKLLLGNAQEIGRLLLAQLTNSSPKNNLTNWNIWTNHSGYLYFQPTATALSTWLKMLFDRTDVTDQDLGFWVAPDHAVASDHLLYYIELRCSQMQQLAELPINPWLQEELNCTHTAELELIHSIIQVYDSLYMGAKYKIVAAGKSLVENFLEFDRTCRLLDLDPHSPAFHERAGLIAIVRSAIRDLQTAQAMIDQPSGHQNI
jgi:hypothetical protein